MVEGTISHELSAEKINELLLGKQPSPDQHVPATEQKQPHQANEAGFFKAKWFKPKLLEGEQVISTLHVGWWKFKLYKLFSTNKRLIVLKKFPKNLIDIDYRQIELVEYYTNVEWAKSLYGILFMALAFFFLTAQETVMPLIYNSAEFLKPILDRGNIFGLTFGSITIFVAFLFVGLYFFGLFFLSLLGSLRILLYEQAPFDITTGMTAHIQDLIRFVEEQKLKLDIPVGPHKEEKG